MHGVALRREVRNVTYATTLNGFPFSASRSSRLGCRTGSGVLVRKSTVIARLRGVE
jgi:hypothetical protein